MSGATFNDTSKFDLIKNPFFVLNLDPAATLSEIAEAVEDAIGDRVATEPQILAAKEALLNPRLRTAIEVSFLFDAPGRQAALLKTALKERTQPYQLYREAERLAPLSRANLLAHIASHAPATADLLFSLIDAHAQTDYEAVQSKLKSVRQEAGLVFPSADVVREELSQLFSLHMRAVITGFLNVRDAARTVQECTNRVLTSADADRVDALEELIRAYHRHVGPELHALEEKVSEIVESLKANGPRDIGVLARVLREWSELANPILRFEAYKGRDDAHARQLFYTVRGLSIGLANEHDLFDLSFSISNVAAEVFSSLPRASEQLQEDLQLLRERVAEQKILPLKNFVDQLSKWTIVADLEAAGFGPSARGDVLELWRQFRTAKDELQNTTAADLPWMLIRSLAIDLNNDENSPIAAGALLRGLINLAAPPIPSAALIENLRDNLRKVQRNALEKRVIKSVESNDLAAAISGLNELLQEATPEERVSFANLKARLERKRAARYVKWAVFASIGALMIIGAISDKSTRAPSPPPSSWSSPRMDTRAPTTWPSSSVGTESPDASESFTEAKPPVGSTNVFTRSNVRYCRYQKERMRILEQDLRNSFEIDAFNQLVDDYNSRCSHFRYYEQDVSIVSQEVNSRAENLAQGARSILLDWRRSRPSAGPNVPLPSPSIAWPPNVPSSPPVQPSPMGEPGLSNSTPPPEANVDLLQLDTAIAVQKGLQELRYFAGPINGVWGPQSRSSLRTFKTANGLPADDVLDTATLALLNSRAAVRNANPKAATAPSQPADETHYAPPAGASLNPLNKGDSIRIHGKLRELGFYRAANSTLWSGASRDGLREFKTRSGLEANDTWDAVTEQRLLSATPPRNSAELQQGFTATVSGVWSADLKACPGASGGSDALPVTISANGAEAEGGRCLFHSFTGAGTSWKAVATCSTGAETWKTSISLVRTSDVLTWSSPKGIAKYYRCPD
jgi:peptidoglycan hydrolase-like protein with peptidoglycan-binding domain